jgi:hypothetical protein
MVLRGRGVLAWVKLRRWEDRALRLFGEPFMGLQSGQFER